MTLKKKTARSPREAKCEDSAPADDRSGGMPVISDENWWEA